MWKKGLMACESYLTQIFPDSELINMSPSQIKDPKSQLQEKAQSQSLGTPIYKTVSSSGPDHARKFTVTVSLPTADKSRQGREPVNNVPKPPLQSQPYL